MLAVEQLARAEVLRAELVEELAHELRAPLQVIDGYVEGMLDGVLEREDATLALIRREAGRSVRLLDDLAYLTRLETAARSEQPDRVDLAAAVDESIARFAPLAAAAGTTLRSEAEPVTALVPRGRLEQVLVNLTRNALRAVAEDGSAVTLFARAEGEWAVVGVEDDGPGDSPGEITRVFDRFYRGRVDARSPARQRARPDRRAEDRRGCRRQRLSAAARAAGRPRGRPSAARLRAARAACRKPSCRWASTVSSGNCIRTAASRTLAPRSATRSSTRHCATGSASSSRGGRIELRPGRPGRGGDARRRGGARAAGRRPSPAAPPGLVGAVREGLLDNVRGQRHRRRRCGGRARTQHGRCARSARRGLRQGPMP